MDASKQVARVIARLTREPITALEGAVIMQMQPCRTRYPVGTKAKRFMRDIKDATHLTMRQRDYLWQIAWRYRRQLPYTLWTAVHERRIAAKIQNVNQLTFKDAVDGDHA